MASVSDDTYFLQFVRPGNDEERPLPLAHVKLTFREDVPGRALNIWFKIHPLLASGDENAPARIILQRYVDNMNHGMRDMGLQAGTIVQDGLTVTMEYFIGDGDGELDAGTVKKLMLSKCMQDLNLATTDQKAYRAALNASPDENPLTQLLIEHLQEKGSKVR